MVLDQKTLVRLLGQGGVGVMATDTLYGLVGSALSPKAVERIYELRQRKRDKPMIILIGSIDDLSLFRVRVDKETGKLLRQFWPGKISIILPCRDKKFFYLHRGTKSLAFRLPKKLGLIRLLKKTGPLVAPSANIEGQRPARTIREAKRYFGNKVDFYVQGGKLSSLPSTLIVLKKGRVILKRQGAYKITKLLS